jgi:dephospho-CoA kinase
VKLIGLTGGVGSGKSTVAAMLRDLGAVVVDADEATHAVYEPGTPGFDAVAQEFGDYYIRDGRIDRQRLGELVFKDAASRRRLNAIVHPLVREWMAARTAEAADRGAEIVVQEVPLLFENGLEPLYSSVVLVYVPEAMQLERLVAPSTATFRSRGFTADRARAVIATQVPIEEKRRRADHVIDNSGTLEATRRQVEQLWAKLVGK